MINNIEKLKELANEFVGYQTCFYRDEEDDNSFCWTDDYKVETGASKIVLIPEDEMIDKVIKIPFLGTTGYVPARELCALQYENEQRNECECNGKFYCCQYEDCQFYNTDDEETYYNESYSGANSIDGNDYCEEEAAVYLAAEEVGLSELFAKTEYLFTTDTGVKVYVQDRVANNNEDSIEKTPSQKAVEEFNTYSKDNSNAFILSHCFGKIIIDYYGLEKFIQLVNFMSKHDLGDFHSANVGYDENEKPIIFDYSNYRS